MKFYKLSKDGKLYSSKDGDLVARHDYEFIAKRERILRKNISLEHFKFQLLEFIEQAKLNAGSKLAGSMMIVNFICFLDFFLKNPINSDKSSQELPSE